MEKTVKHHLGPTASLNLKSVARQMAALAALEARINNCQPDETFLANAQRTAMGIFRLVVMGEIKKGKSSFINALAGTENLVPVNSDVATSTIFKVHYGPEVKYTVYLEKDSGKGKLVIGADQVNEYGTEDGNPENSKCVDYIRVESPSPILRNGLVIVDTPGVGGLFKKHREITFRHAPNADAVFFVMDSIESPLGGDEVRFLRELRQITPLITFIQTKAAAVDGEARMARMANNLRTLRDHVGMPDAEIAYFIVDSNLKIEADKGRDTMDLDDSGFMPLMAHLNNSLRKDQEASVARSAISQTMARVGPLEASLANRKRIIGANTEENQEKIAREITLAQERMAEWDKSVLPRIREQFRRGIGTLSREVQDDLKPLQPGGRIQVDFEAKLETAGTIDEVKALLAQVDNDLAALASAACLKIGKKAQNGLARLLETLTADLVSSLDGKCDLSLEQVDGSKLWVNTSGIVRLVNRDMEGSVFETARTFTYGGMAGVAIAGIAGGIVGSVIPVVGTIVGSWVGVTLAGLWGGTMATAHVDSQKLENLKRESYAALGGALGTAYQSAMGLVNGLISEMQIMADARLQAILTEAKEMLTQIRNDLSRRQRATQAEVLKEVSVLTSLESELACIKSALAEFRKQLPA